MNLPSKSLALGCAFAVAGCAQTGFSGSSGALGSGGLSMLPGAAHTGSPMERMHRRSGSSGPEIYVFAGSPDAYSPQSGVVHVGNTLFGTTYYGGANNEGALYSVTTAGVESVMHSFPTGSNDGYYPDAPLTAVKGTLYGTTYYGGTNNHGTVFSITPSGGYKVLYNFANTSNDAASPDTALTYVPSQKALYGVAFHGGPAGDGCIYKLSLASKNLQESIVYSFTGSTSSSTGASAPVYYKNALYVTTPEGGAGDHGAVLKVTLSGQESVVYSFKDEPDGANPYAALVVHNGALYGTTGDGGQGACGGYAGCGIIFKVTPAGKEKVLYSFKDSTSAVDGGDPQSPLIVVGGTLYGTAPCTGPRCSSVIFAESPSGGTDTIVYDFESVSTEPYGYPVSAFYGPPLSLNGMFYGTSSGSAHVGDGTVWAVPQ